MCAPTSAEDSEELLQDLRRGRLLLDLHFPFRLPVLLLRFDFDVSGKNEDDAGENDRGRDRFEQGVPLATEIVLDRRAQRRVAGGHGQHLANEGGLMILRWFGDSARHRSERGGSLASNGLHGAFGRDEGRVLRLEDRQVLY